MTGAEPGHAPRPGARTDGVELLLLQGLPEARASLAALAASEEAPREIPPAMVGAHAPRADARQQQALRAVADAAEGEAEAGAPADAPDAELGALLRHMSGSGAPLRAQRMADGSWVARLVFPGEGAVSIRISQSPDLVSVRLGGDGELAKRVREAIEGGLARQGRRVAVDTTDAG
ncbi:MAG: hypothetical protein FJX21_05295 [Alphaproteobacteria bacterium]|nr:hypothetical protein [Alphaproteobacteria bacterium]